MISELDSYYKNITHTYKLNQEYVSTLIITIACVLVLLAKRCDDIQRMLTLNWRQNIHTYQKHANLPGIKIIIKGKEKFILLCQ